MKQSGVRFSDKYATQLTISKHFYDVTALRKKMGNKMAEGMLAPYRKVLKRAERKRKQ